MIAKSWETFVGVYRPPTSVTVPQSLWRIELSTILESITLIPGNCFLLGDYNSDLLLPDKPPKDGRRLLDLLGIYSMHNLINEPTRITKTNKSILNLILTNNKNKVLRSGVIHVNLSDHSLVYAILRKTVHKRRSKKLCFRSLKHFDRGSFLRDFA